jgi:Na+-translocating ferredoxin:NAD+ oxidoreductase RnfG subunit
MKSKDWSVIVIIVVISAVASLVVSNVLIGSKKLGKLKVEEVNELSAKFILPNEQYFNKKSINPTKEIKIGDGNNASPFQTNQ